MFLNYFRESKITLLVVLLLVIMMAQAAFMLATHNRQTEQFFQTTDQNQLASRKMQLASTLVEFARARTRLTTEMVYQEDPFVKDEINLELDRMASRFASRRSELLQLGLDAEEQALMQRQAAIVPVILGAQRQAAELAIMGDTEALREAQRLLYEIVFPGQGKIVDLFLELIEKQKRQIDRAAAETRDSQLRALRINRLVFGVSLSAALLFGLLVVMKIRRTERALIDSQRSTRMALDELRHHHDNLEYLVRLRTAELEEMSSAAQAANRAKSEFLATMSHEIRTPMNGVLGMAQMLEQSELNAEQRDYVGTLLQSGKVLLQVINDILDFSKIEAGRMTLESVSFDLEQLGYEVLKLFGPVAEQKGVELIYDHPHDCPRLVRGDMVRIRQVIMNLIGNAIKFTSQGCILLSIAPDTDPEHPDRLRLAVTDTGIGIPLEAQQALFESFTQSDSSTTRKYGGSGLGLAISRRLVQLMGGEMGVESAAGEGSTFWLSIPFAAASAQPLDQEPLLAGRRTLLVEDNPITCGVLQRQLTALGLRAECEERAGRALTRVRQAELQEEPFAVLLFDHSIEDQGAVEFAQALRGATAGANAPRLILLTGGAGQGAQDSACEGFDACLGKPVLLDSLRQTLLRILDEAPAGATPTRQAPADATLEPARTFVGRVLLVEDVRANQLVAGAMLRKLGMTVVLANNGEEGVRLWRQERFALIFMDCQMPLMDGFEATRRIRAAEREEPTEGGVHTPIIALTANAFESDRQKCLDAGMDDFLSKPFQADDLRARVERWLSATGEQAPD